MRTLYVGDSCVDAKGYSIRPLRSIADPASGGSEDWAKGKVGVKYAYLFELRPEEQVWDGFLLAENQILPTSRETFEAVKVIADSVLRSFPKTAGMHSDNCA